MGFRSGDWAGHLRGMMLWSENHLSAFLEVCFGSLSCWKYHSSSAISRLSKLSPLPPPNLTIMLSIHHSCTSTSFPTPFQPIDPQTIRWFPPPCLTVGAVVQSDCGSPHFFQTYTFPSDPILLIFVSSVHNTLFQSSIVQFSWYWANFRCHWRWVPLSIGTFFFVADCKPASFNMFLTVWGVMGVEVGGIYDWVAWTALSSFPELIWRMINCLSWGEAWMDNHQDDFPYLLTDPTNGTLPQTSPSVDLTLRIALIEERNNRRVLFSRDRFHGGGESQEDEWTKFNMPNWYK